MRTGFSRATAVSGDSSGFRWGERPSLLQDTLQGYGVSMVGYEATKQDHLLRLRRIEGQVRGLQRLVEQDTYCIDVLTQISATTRALQSVALRLLDEHLHHCVMTAVEGGGAEGEEKVSEAFAAIERLVRS